MKKMLMVTGLPVWSIRKGVGAPSFYKTIELYNNNDWKIDFWTTEKKLDLSEFENVLIRRMPSVIPLIQIPIIYSLLRNLRFIINQVILLFTFLFSANKKYDIIYGYEVEFIPGLKLISKIIGIPFISRFQGTILHPLMKKKCWKLHYLPHSWAIAIESSLTIMTDDGTLGDEVISVLRGETIGNCWFVRNGVDDHQILEENLSQKLLNLVKDKKSFNLFLSVSRIQSWKRIDRSLDIFKKVLEKEPQSIYLIGGDGAKKEEWMEYASKLGISENVFFLGGINKDEVYYLQQEADFFLSSYELSNMGNPLFEAMKNGCVVVTINNGSTGKMIKDNVNGIISNEDKYLDNSNKIISLLNDTKHYDRTLACSLSTFDNEFTTWDLRMKNELSKVGGLLL